MPQIAGAPSGIPSWSKSKKSPIDVERMRIDLELAVGTKFLSEASTDTSCMNSHVCLSAHRLESAPNVRYSPWWTRKSWIVWWYQIRNSARRDTDAIESYIRLSLVTQEAGQSTCWFHGNDEWMNPARAYNCDIKGRYANILMDSKPQGRYGPRFAWTNAFPMSQREHTKKR